MDYLKAVSENLKYLMEEKELNCTELSRAVKIDRSAIARYLRGERLPSTPSLIAFADFFGCSADFILGRDEIPAEFAAKPCPPYGAEGHISGARGHGCPRRRKKRIKSFKMADKIFQFPLRFSESSIHSPVCADWNIIQNPSPFISNSDTGTKEQ